MIPTRDELAEIEAAFARALDVEAHERAAVLATLAPALQREVERLLAVDDWAHPNHSNEDPFDTAIGGAIVGWLDSSRFDESDRDPLPDEDPWLGRTVGAWRLVRLLGRGGMSHVYLAEKVDREIPIEAALKLIKRGMDSEDLLRRFRTERRILANLVHPNIARLLDGGAADDGTPYFVMERVQGERIDAYADRRQLSLAARVALMRQVAGAVAAAHRRLIVHRDLKPSNILVTEDGTPKLLDFGIAKLLGPESVTEGNDDRTATELRVLTPGYASPEQFAGEPPTTATDVYSLGIVLCELLAGRKPFRRPLDKDRGEPERPSLALFREVRGEPTARELAAQRGLEPKALARALTGDLDTIVETCLRREPERRYASADRLADDLGRYLEARPIEARRDSLRYRAGKFLRRHRLAVAATAAAALLVAGFVVALVVQSTRLARERDGSQRERRRAEAVADFLIHLFQAQPGADGGTVTARELLDHATAEIDTAVPSAAESELEDPRIRSTLLDTVGRVYHQLGLYEQAQAPLEAALALRRRHLPADDPETAESVNRLAVLAAERGSYERAIALFREALAIRRRHFGSSSGPVAASLSNLALALQDNGAYREAAPLYREAITIDSRLLPPDDPGLLATRMNLALLLLDLGAATEAEAMLREVRDRGDWPADDPERAELDRYLGLALTAQRRFSEAEPLLVAAEATVSQALGAEHPEVARAAASLAELHLARGQAPQALVRFEKAVAIRRARLGPDHPELILSRVGLARARVALGERDAALAELRGAVALARKVLPARHPELATALAELAKVLVTKGAVNSEACALAHEAREIRTAAYPAGDTRTRDVERMLDGCAR